MIADNLINIGRWFVAQTSLVNLSANARYEMSNPKTPRLDPKESPSVHYLASQEAPFCTGK